MIALILGIVFFVAVLAWDLKTDLKKWKANKSINHRKEFWIRGLLLLPSESMFYIFKEPDHLNLLLIVYVLVMVCFLYWFLFDGLYNRLRGFAWGYFGSEGDPGGDSGLDEFQRRIGLFWALVLKLGLFSAGLLLYILT